MKILYVGVNIEFNYFFLFCCFFMWYCERVILKYDIIKFIYCLKIKNK